MKGVALGIAHAGLTDGDASRLRAMLLLALAEGTLIGHWYESEPEDSDVLVTSAKAYGELAQRLPQSRARIVAILGESAVPSPPGTFRLGRPISVDALLGLLTVAEGRVAGAPIAASTAQEHGLMQLAALIRSHGGTGAGRAWRISGLARAPIYAVPEDRQFFCTESLFAVQSFDLQTRIIVTPLAPGVPPVRARPRPLVMLQWAVGLMTGPLGLLPWLDPGADFRLRAFPEFQVVHHEPVHRRMAAAFAQPVASLASATDLLQLDTSAVVGFINAAELCGYLQTTPANGAGAQRRGRGRGALMNIFRRALGIGKTDV
jgi:hypothetical protein